jgi:hypothetical protein
MSEILEKLKLLFEEYKKSLNEFGVRPAPLPSDIGIPNSWIGWKLSSRLSPRLSPAPVTSQRPSLSKFREKISQFPSATSTSIIRANEDVQAIKNKFAREFWFTSGKETVKVIARAKLAEVNFCTISSLILAIDVLVS